MQWRKKWNGSDSSSDFDLITQNSTFVYLKLGFALNIDRVGIIVPLEPFLWVQFNDPERLLVSLYFWHQGKNSNDNRNTINTYIQGKVSSFMIRYIVRTRINEVVVERHLSIKTNVRALLINGLTDHTKYQFIHLLMLLIVQHFSESLCWIHILNKKAFL